MASNFDFSKCPEWTREGFADLEALAEIFGLTIVGHYCFWQLEEPLWVNTSCEEMAIKVTFGDGNQTAMIEKHGRNFWTDKFIPGVKFLLRLYCLDNGKDQFLIRI